MATATATKSKSPSTTTPTQPVETSDISKVEVGHYFSRHSFGKVLEKAEITDPQTGDTITVLKVENADGTTWLVDGPLVEKEFSFADQHDTEEKVSRTALIDVLKENPHTAMTVNYRKKTDPKEVAKLLKDGQGTVATRTWNKRVKEALAGAQSELVGYHTNSFDEHQYLRFIKLNSSGSRPGPAFRLVDVKKIDSLIVRRKKYVVKK
jgi:hypothetical protein